MRREYGRSDLPVRVRSGDGGTEWVVGLAGFSREGTGDVLPPHLLQGLPMDAFRQEPPRGPALASELNRIVLSPDPELSPVDWEAALSPLLPLVPFPSYGQPSVVVRETEVQPRFAGTNFKLPLRILQLDARPEHPLPGWIRQVFGGHPDGAVEKAVVVETRSLGPDAPRWPVIDILHVDTWPAGTAGELLTNDAKRSGTLGWFARWTGAWETRLLAIHCDSEDEAAVARTLAQRLCGKGGPAVLIGPPGAPVVFWTVFYDRLIHDDPLDQALVVASSQTGRPGVLYASGPDRVEGVRVSNAGSAIADRAGKTVPLTPGIADFAQKWNGWTFSVHEGDGLIPMAAAVDRLRATETSISFADDVYRETRGFTAPARFVNATFWRSANGGRERMEPTAAPLQSGVGYELGVQIGSQEDETAVLDARAILEEVFRWSVNQRGVWVEIGVVGLDFDVHGDPVQPLWLPREGPSATAYFAVSTNRTGPVRLRYGLYYENNLIQSFRMAAYAVSASGDRITPSSRDGGRHSRSSTMVAPAPPSC